MAEELYWYVGMHANKSENLELKLEFPHASTCNFSPLNAKEPLAASDKSTISYSCKV